MRRPLLMVIVWVSAALVGAGIVTGPANAAMRDTRLTVTVRPNVGEAKSVWLTCEPAGGTHPKAAPACATLRAAHGNPSAIPDADGLCTMQYAPVTATVQGRWHHHAVRYRQIFSNDCVMRRATGPLFEL